MRFPSGSLGTRRITYPDIHRRDAQATDIFKANDGAPGASYVKGHRLEACATGKGLDTIPDDDRIFWTEPIYGYFGNPDSEAKYLAEIDEWLVRQLGK
jgi:hypothetical protein